MLARDQRIVVDGDIALGFPSQHVFVPGLGQFDLAFTLLANEHTPAVALNFAG
jgi:hypothetical protein